MNTTLKVIAGVGIAAVLAIAFALGAAVWFVNNAYAQTPTPNQYAYYGACHNNQAVLDLLKLSASDLRAQRQAGKSLLDIAAAKEVSEKQLVDALIQPIGAMHAWMAQNYPQSNATQMTQYMRDWIAKDIRETKFGTMTDARLFGGGMGAGTMGGYSFNGANGWGGMIGGKGMMGGW